jgi:hypothetical protein
MTKKSEFLHGTCEQLLFSPGGKVEGALVKVGRKTVQVVCERSQGPWLAGLVGPGRRAFLFVTLDRSKKSSRAAHPVFTFDGFADSTGKPLDPEDGGREATLTGVVQALHFARHGEPNGVMLRGGEFVHVRPAGMRRLRLKVGSKVKAVGERSVTVLGTEMLEARQVNRVKL